MEACGPSGWINYLALSLGLKTFVCSTNEGAGYKQNVDQATATAANTSNRDE
jgi:transposase